MIKKLSILCCNNFLKEVAAAVVAEDADDVIVAPFPSRCGRPPVGWEELRALVPQDCAQVVVLGTACLNDIGEPPPNFPQTRLVRMTQCFHLVAGEQMVADAIAGGAYLVTPGWLSDWRGQLEAQGFAPEQAGDFYRDFARELVVLDTGTDPQVHTKLTQLQSALKIPLRRINIGLDHTRLFLARLILEWRLEQTRIAAQEQERRQAGELADHIAANDMLEKLARTQSETEAIASIEELFNMLFAPAALYHLRVENQVPIADKPIPAALLQIMNDLRDDYAWTPDGTGFLLRIKRDGDTLGLVAVDRLSFPQYRQRYLNMALACADFCGLAIENARNHRRLLEMEKMSSLATMVAGIAHEINTPLGVSLTATSILKEQSGKLADQFAERSMTQSDLNAYLEKTREGTILISNSLERIANLLEAFRQVAVDGNPRKKQLFRINDCLDKVIRSMEHHLSNEHVTVNVECDPALEIEGIPADWSNIFSNLIDNSLKHGFKDRGHGVINFTIGSTEHFLRIEYRDNGIGMVPEVQSRIFDPFFTTDMQHGMGLGMHLLYNLITHRMDGTILLTSKPDQGVCYQIKVPK